jgi:hypothetical protein
MNVKILKKDYNKLNFKLKSTLKFSIKIKLGVVFDLKEVISLESFSYF